MQGPWYTLEETAQKLGILKSELIHKIIVSEASASILLKNANLLYLTADAKGNWIGRASFTYTGHVAYPLDILAPLLDGVELEVSRIPAKILEPVRVSQWNSSNPWKFELPEPPIYKWQGREFESLNGDNLYAVSLPKETFDVSDQLTRLTEQMETISKTGRMAGVENKMKRVLNFPHFKIKPEAIRLAASELNKLKEKPRIEANTTKPNIPIINHELHALIYRILSNNPKISAKGVWKLIREDFESDNPAYDTEGILVDATYADLLWKTPRGDKTAFSYSSLNSTMSKLRRQHSIL
ncbi:hypothetical protein [uncultured Gilvimarinus sp.]|uniref:hypothetical protein n=1 Tax=uncultured Gilvimarinus sp. TaxID=1689143 RepID=UPI0030DDABB9